MNISNMNLGTNLSNHIPISDPVELEIQERPLWREYAKMMGDRGLYVGVISPNNINIFKNSNDLDIISDIYSHPIRYFGNLRYLFTVDDGSRVYVDTTMPDRLSGSIYLWFTYDNKLEAIDLRERDLIYSVDVCGPYYQKDARDKFISIYLSGDSDKYRNDIVHTAQDFMQGINQDFRFNGSLSYVCLDAHLNSMRGQPMFTDAFGIKHDIMRGYYASSFGNISKHMGNTPYAFTFQAKNRMRLSFYFLHMSQKDSEVLKTVLPEAQAEIADGGNVYLVYRCFQKSWFHTALSIACTVKAYSAEYLRYWDGVDELYPEAERIYNTLCQNNVTVTKDGYYEFDLSL